MTTTIPLMRRMPLPQAQHASSAAQRHASITLRSGRVREVRRVHAAARPQQDTIDRRFDGLTTHWNGAVCTGGAGAARASALAAKAG